MADAGALRLAVAAVLAVLTALVIDRRTATLGFAPPGFALPWRRLGALVVLGSILFLGVFLPFVMFGLEKPPPTAEDLAGPAIFLLQGLLLLALLLWFLLGYAGVAEARPPELPATPPVPPGGEVAAAPPAGVEPGVEPRRRGSLAVVFARQFGLRAKEPLNELGIGVAAGALGWLTVIGLMLAVVAVVWALGGEQHLPTAPPELVPLVAGLPFAIRIGIGVTAGVVEELFFRGFLQPRVGIALSTALFVMAHLSYDAPFMLIGITALSLLFAFLVRWRRNVLAAIVAHATFDLIQLLIVVPQVLKRLPEVAG